MHALNRLTPPILPNILMALTLITASTAIAREQVQEITMMLGDYHFIPDTFTVNAGQPVRLTLTNTDRITPHNFIMKDEAAGLNIDTNVSAGKTTTLEFTPAAAGSYTFYCSKKLPFMKSHKEKGMEGTLIVTNANPD